MPDTLPDEAFRLEASFSPASAGWGRSLCSFSLPIELHRSPLDFRCLDLGLDIEVLRHQQVDVQIDQSHPAYSDISPSLLPRARRARYRLSWKERLERNGRLPTERLVAIKLFGVPEDLANVLGLVSI